MSLQVTGKNIKVGESFQTYVSDKIRSLLQKYVSRDLNGHVRLEKDEQVHFPDVNTIGKRIRELLYSIPEKEWNVELKGLVSLQRQMSRKKPPTMGWLLQNHNYFVRRQNETCDLSSF